MESYFLPLLSAPKSGFCTICLDRRAQPGQNTCHFCADLGETCPECGLPYGGDGTAPCPLCIERHEKSEREDREHRERIEAMTRAYLQFSMFCRCPKPGEKPGGTG